LVKDEALMNIPSYQIQNVLKVYTRQLSQNHGLYRQEEFRKTYSADQINLSAEGKRRAVIEKVATGIVDRITRFGPQDDIDYEIVDQLQNEIGKDIDFDLPKESQFIFNVIDRHNEKKTHNLLVEDGKYLIKRLEELAIGAVDQKMEPALGGL
jgi:hypothetical protein